jgi:hypothetical protein
MNENTDFDIRELPGDRAVCPFPSCNRIVKVSNDSYSSHIILDFIPLTPVLHAPPN